ncbi:Asp23/Gls24 family envelope stress response protein [Nonomuraea basaltis]|nr:Asp23/Gls24 family envelope stress response protein [Nonomuraea basaltis]
MAGGDEAARLIAARVRACPGVAGLSGGPFGTVATYLPGERLVGVSVDDGEVEIAVVATMDRPLPETADEVRRAVADLAGDRLVNVRIDDIVEGSWTTSS